MAAAFRIPLLLLEEAACPQRPPRRGTPSLGPAGHRILAWQSRPELRTTHAIQQTPVGRDREAGGEIGELWIARAAQQAHRQRGEGHIIQTLTTLNMESVLGE